MATELLQVGVVTALTQNVVYAMPATRTRGYVGSLGGGLLQFSNTVDFVSSTTGTISADLSFETSAAFMRCTSTTGTVRLLKF